jgi:hypothetical protein
MGKSRWSKIVAEISRSENTETPQQIGTAAVAVHSREEQEAGVSESDGFVVLDAHRRSGKADTSSFGRRAGARAVRASRSNKIGEQIGEQLRCLYNDVLTQPIPDRFVELLNKLEESTISPSAEPKAPRES